MAAPVVEKLQVDSEMKCSFSYVNGQRNCSRPQLLGSGVALLLRPPPWPTSCRTTLAGMTLLMNLRVSTRTLTLVPHFTLSLLLDETKEDLSINCDGKVETLHNNKIVGCVLTLNYSSRYLLRGQL